jgi:hypothetical protein
MGIRQDLNDQRIESLLDQLQVSTLTEVEISRIEKKIEVLRSQQ